MRLVARLAVADLLFNPFTFREIELRDLIATGRPSEAVRIVDTPPVDATPAAPQWHIIERVTSGRVLLEAGERQGTAEPFRTAAVQAAEAHRLPHQIQRAIRAAESGHLLKSPPTAPERFNGSVTSSARQYWKQGATTARTRLEGNHDAPGRGWKSSVARAC